MTLDSRVVEVRLCCMIACPIPRLRHQAPKPSSLQASKPPHIVIDQDVSVYQPYLLRMAPIGWEQTGDLQPRMNPSGLRK